MLHESTEDDIRNSLVKLFEIEAKTTDAKSTIGEEFGLNQGPAFSAVNFAKFRGTAVKKFENSAVIPR